MPRLAFHEAATAFVEVVDEIPPDAWSRPALGQWTVQELVGHALRAFTTIEAYAAKPAGVVEVEDPLAYFRRVLSGGPALHADVAERGRQAGRDLGHDPALIVRTTADRVLAWLPTLPDELVVGSAAGGIRLIDYLPTRVVELVVHTLDLTDALGRPPNLPEWPARITIDTLAGLADRAGEADLIRALTGRRPLPPGYNVLG